MFFCFGIINNVLKIVDEEIKIELCYLLNRQLVRCEEYEITTTTIITSIRTTANTHQLQ